VGLNDWLAVSLVAVMLLAITIGCGWASVSRSTWYRDRNRKRQARRGALRILAMEERRIREQEQRERLRNWWGGGPRA